MRRMDMTKAGNAREINNLTRAIAEQIDEERRHANLTNLALYTAAGVAKSTYGYISRGERAIDFSSADKLAHVFGLTLGELITRAEARIVEDTSVTTTDDADAVEIPMPPLEAARSRSNGPRRTARS